MIGGIVGFGFENYINSVCNENYYCKYYAAFSHHFVIEPIIDNYVLTMILKGYGHDNQESWPKFFGQVAASIIASEIVSEYSNLYYAPPLAGMLGSFGFELAVETVDLIYKLGVFSDSVVYYL